jgi:hypothetical protein
VNVAGILQLLGFGSVNAGVFLFNVPAGFVSLGLSFVLIGVALERANAE